MVHPVTFAGGCFEAVAIDNCDLAMVVADEPGALEFPSSFGNPGSAYTEH